MANVLIVDDDSAIRASVRAALEDERHSVLEALDGAGALELLRGGESPLVVLLDLLLPGVSGFDMLSQIAQDWELAGRHAHRGFTANVQSLPGGPPLPSRIVASCSSQPL